MPSATNTNASNLLKSQGKLHCNVFVGHFQGTKMLNLKSLFLGHFGIKVFLAALTSFMCNHIAHVVFVGVVSQIAKMVIRCIAVIVANVKSFWSLAKKMLCNDKVDTALVFFPVFRKRHVIATLFINCFDKLATFKIAKQFAFCVWDNSVKAAKVSKTGNLIKAFIAGNWKPNFCHGFTSDSKKLCVMNEGRLHRNNFSGATLACQG